MWCVVTAVKKGCFRWRQSLLETFREKQGLNKLDFSPRKNEENKDPEPQY